MERKTTARITNSSTRHVLEAMRIIARSSEPLGLKEIAEELELPPSTTHRALMTLEESGFAERGRQSARFVSGSILDHLVRSMIAQFPVRAATAPTLRRTSREFDVSTTLNWRLGSSSIRLASFDGMQESFQRRRIGEIRPLHDGIGPAAILMSLQPDEFDRYLAGLQAGARNSESGISGERLDTYRTQMAEQGFLELPPRDEFGFHWISVPLLRPDAAVCGSFSAGIPTVMRSSAKLSLEIASICAALADLQAILDDNPGSTQSNFDGLDHMELIAESSPKRWKSQF